MAILSGKKQTKKAVEQKRHNTDAENKLLFSAIDKFKEAESSKIDFDNQQLHSKWKKYDQIYRGKQWFETVSADRSTPVLNFTQSLIHAVMPRMTENQPEVLLMPRSSPSDAALAISLTSVVEHIWYSNRMQEERLPEAVLQALKYGTAIFKTLWDPEMWDGVGDVRYSVIHPINFFPDPRATNVRDMEYCFVKVAKPIEYFTRRWGNKGHLVTPDNDWTSVESLQGTDHTSEDRATLTEFWFRDSNGDLCVMYYAGHIVLALMGGEHDTMEDFKGKPIYLHNRFPFAAMHDYKVDKHFWGIGEVELCDTLQRLINAYEAQIVDNTRLMGNAQWLVNKTLSGLDESDAWIFDNQPGRTIFTHNGGVDRAPGVPIPHHIPEHMERLIFWLEQVTGIFDVMQGRRPVGVRAASAIIALQESGSVRIREKAKNMAAAIREMTEQATWLALENYDEKRVIRVAGEMVPVSLDVRAALYERVLDMARAAELLPPEVLSGEGEPVPPEVMEQLMTEVKFPEFDVRVKVGPSVPYSSALLYEQSKEFYQLGIIDRRAVLENTGFPNREEILQRMEAAEAGAVEEEEERAGERTF